MSARPIVALCSAILVLAVVSIFIRATARVETTPEARHVAAARGQFDVEVTLTFDAAPDTFDLEATHATALVIEHLQQTILRRENDIEAGEMIVIRDVKGIVPGKNTFFIRCSPKDIDSDLARAVRIRILRDGGPISHDTLWSEPGEPCEGVIELHVENSE